MREQKEWEDLILYFEDEAGLEKHIKDNWESRAFMTEFFSFFNEGVSVDCSKKLRKRFILVCEIVTKLYLKGGQKRSWFWTIRHILYLFEDYFEAKKDVLSLMAIIYYYYFFDDVQHQRRFLLNQGEYDSTFLSEFLNKFMGTYTLSDLKEYEIRAKVELKDLLL